MKHGFIGDKPGDATRSSWSGRTHPNEGLTFPGHEGRIDVLGGDWQNAVYRVVLSGGNASGGCRIASQLSPRSPWSGRTRAPTASQPLPISKAFLFDAMFPIPWIWALHWNTYEGGVPATTERLCFLCLAIPLTIRRVRDDQAGHKLLRPRPRWEQRAELQQRKAKCWAVNDKKAAP